MPVYVRRHNGETLTFEHGHEISLAAGTPSAQWVVKAKKRAILAMIPVGEVLDHETRHRTFQTPNDAVA